MNLVDEMHAVASALAASNVCYAICGGLAVSIHGAVRTTKDIDLLVAPDDLERCFAAVRRIGYEFLAEPMTFGVGTATERRVQRISKIEGAEHVMLDILIADAYYADMLADRLEIDLPEGRIAVVSRATLIRMKRAANRPQDLADLENLEG